MEQNSRWLRWLLRIMSYVLVASVASVITLLLWGGGYSKLTELEQVIDDCFIGTYDEDTIRDAAAQAMVEALSDRWSSYMSPEDYAAYQESISNTYVGVGITIVKRADGTGLDIQGVTPGGSAQQAGVLPGDVVIAVQGQSVDGLSVGEIRNLIVGEAGKQVSLTVMREQEELTFALECRTLQVAVATGTLLEGNVGLIRIANFNENCAAETIAAIDALRAQGAQSLLFDVRNNPGGYVSEMVKVLDYLLPEGVLFRSVDYRGQEGTEHSDAASVDMPMAVLVNGESYSAAEFFAACLREKDWAKVVGTQTCGKGYFQNTIKLSDGSAVHLSTGKYFTPNGVNLTEAGGLTPDTVVPVDEKTAALIYAEALPAGEDPQLQAALLLLTQNNG